MKIEHRIYVNMFISSAHLRTDSMRNWQTSYSQITNYNINVCINLVDWKAKKYFHFIKATETKKFGGKKTCNIIFSSRFSDEILCCTAKTIFQINLLFFIVWPKKSHQKYMVLYIAICTVRSVMLQYYQWLHLQQWFTGYEIAVNLNEFFCCKI